MTKLQDDILFVSVYLEVKSIVMGNHLWTSLNQHTWKALFIWVCYAVHGACIKDLAYIRNEAKCCLLCCYCRHIILCGYITKQSVETFLRDFLHKDRSNTQVNAVIMGKWVIIIIISLCILSNVKTQSHV